MIQIHKKRLSQLKEDWNNLIAQNPSINPVQGYEFTRLLCKWYFPYFLSGRGEVPQFYSFTDNSGKVVAIAPMCHKLFSKTYTSIGKSLSIPNRDFIYSQNICISTLSECIMLIIKQIGGATLYDIPDGSKMHEVMLQKGFEICQEFPYVCIPMSEGYEQWYNSLDKHVKQNIRTAYNRLRLEDKNVLFEIIEGKNIGSRTMRRLMDIYIKRRDDHEDHDNFVHKWMIRHCHFYTKASLELENSLFGILKIEGEIVSFWSGFYSLDKDYITIPRLSIDNEYKKYSPGTIIICETAKVLKSEWGINKFDLSRGNHGYKLKMGGIQTMAHSYVLK